LEHVVGRQEDLEKLYARGMAGQTTMTRSRYYTPHVFLAIAATAILQLRVLRRQCNWMPLLSGYVPKEIKSWRIRSIRHETKKICMARARFDRSDRV
jgi:hypothetical protein